MKKDEKSGQEPAEEGKQELKECTCKEDLAKKDKEIEELTDTLKRVQAEFINYKNRVEKEMQQCRTYAEEHLIKSLLPLVDSFELALKNKRAEDDFTKGIEMIYAQFYNMLKQEGVSPIEALGKRFDPYLHEVLLKAKSDKESETVIEELQKGYMLKGKVLRHSKVKISE